jgi:hypothetical protein
MNEDGSRNMDTVYKGGTQQEVLYFVIYGITISNDLKKI